MRFQIKNVLVQTGAQGSGKTRKAIELAKSRGEHLISNIESFKAREFTIIRTVIIEGAPNNNKQFREISAASQTNRDVLFIVNDNQHNVDELKKDFERWI